LADVVSPSSSRRWSFVLYVSRQHVGVIAHWRCIPALGIVLLGWLSPVFEASFMFLAESASHAIGMTDTLTTRLRPSLLAQAGARWRSFDPARQERLVVRVADMLADPRCTQVGSHGLGGTWRWPFTLGATYATACVVTVCFDECLLGDWKGLSAL
jgi:hypothetical protein